MIDRLEALLSAEGSTRSAALMRIGLALLLWTRFGREMAPFATIEPDRLLLGASFFLSTTLLLVGWRSRLAAAWAGATLVVVVWGYGIGQDVEDWRHHHTTLLAQATCLLAFTPCGGSYSVDRWLAVRRAGSRGEDAPPERGPTWGLTLIALQLAAVYLYSAWDKSSWVFLSGQRLEQIFVHLYLGFRPEIPGWRAAMAAMAWATVILEVVLPIGLFSRRLRPWLIPIGIALHALFYVLLPVRTFSCTMILLYLAFLDPDDVHRFLDDLQQPARRPA